MLPQPESSRLVARLAEIPILIYHKIDERNEFGINALSPVRFAEQMRQLKSAGYQTITFRDVLAEKKLPSKAIIITFDDGYRSVYQQALPIMRPLGFRGVVYLIGNFIGRNNDWDVQLAGSRFQHMDRDQLIELVEYGWELGGHTMTHRALPYLSAADLAAEISESYRLVETLSGREPLSFGYPFGLHSRRVRRAVREAGFRFGCAGVGGGGKTTDPFNLGRIPIYQFNHATLFSNGNFVGQLPALQRTRLRLLAWPAIFTPIYQLLFRKNLYLR